MLRARIYAASLVGALIAIGAAISLGADTGSIWRELGLAVLSGGIVGGALVMVESLLTGAADRRADLSALRLTLTTTIELNGIDLSSADLAGLYLPGRALVAARLTNADLSNTKLQFADLRHAQLGSAVLRNADLRGATLAHADLRGADLRNVLLDDADLSFALLDEADLTGSSLLDTRLQGTRLKGAAVAGARIGNSILNGADLSSVHGQLRIVGPLEYDAATVFPAGLEVPASADVIQAPIATMDLAEYLAHRPPIGSGEYEPDV